MLPCGQVATWNGASVQVAHNTLEALRGSECERGTVLSWRTPSAVPSFYFRIHFFSKPGMLQLGFNARHC
jgi:GTPase